MVLALGCPLCGIGCTGASSREGWGTSTSDGRSMGGCVLPSDAPSIAYLAILVLVAYMHEGGCHPSKDSS